MINPAKLKLLDISKIYAVNGFEINLYKNNMLRSVSSKYNDNIELKLVNANSEAKGRQEFLKVNPTSARTLTLQAKLYNDYGLQIQQNLIDFEILAATGLTATKNIVMVGDSITQNFNLAELVRQNFVSLGGTQPSFLGTQGGATAYHEGYGGKTFAWFNSDQSPFWNGTQISFADYSTTNLGGATIDLLSFQLGVNDCFSGLLDTSGINTIVQHAKDLIDAFLSYNPSGKVVIILPNYGVNSADGWADDYHTNYTRNDYTTNIFNLHEALINEFDSSSYHANVSVNIGGLCMDRNDGFAKDAAQDKNSRIPAQVELYNNALHPTGTGGAQTIADAIFPHFLKLLS